MANSTPLVQEELLQERLSDAEVREILTRLSAEDLGGPEESTVAAVCEATNAPPEVIGRILADIRQVDLIDRFGKVLRKHETRISNLEVQTERLAKRATLSPSPPRVDPLVSAKMQEIAEREIAKEKALPWVIGIMAFLFLLMMPVMCPSPKASEPATGNSSTPPSSWNQ